ncbi:hypothetical protein [Archangium primigenium]|uniref:hypothetical protein n=1 Tax=[Archangium] primigenium TaxID=2792470 RepID=UPI001EF7A18A|nr:hypothetical protein [Archangium primigenium]MBM7112551.1 hypothetical protein [Archangium primigenium]
MSAPLPLPPVSSARPSLSWLWGLVGWAVAVGLAHHAVLRSGLTVLQGDEGDVRFVHYVLEHGWRFVHGDAGHERFWDAPFFFPVRNTVAYSDPLVGVLPLYAVWRALGVGPDRAFALWVLAVTSLNFWAARWFLSRPVGASVGAATVGAVLFAAGASRINQANHVQLLPQFYSLLALGAVVMLARAETSRQAGVGWAALLVGGSVAQLLAGFYWGWFLGFFLVLAGLVALGFRDTRAVLLGGLRLHGLALVGWGVVGAVVIWPLVGHSLAAAREVGLRSFGEAEGMIPRFATWFHMGDANWLYGWTAGWRAFARLPVEGEHRVGLGVLTPVLAGVGLWRFRERPLARLLMGVLLVTVLLATRYRGGWTPWVAVFHGFPGGNAVRAVCRMGVWLLVPASVGVALALTRLTDAGRGGAAALLGVGCLLEQGVSGATFDPAVPRADARWVAEQVGPDCRAFLYTPTLGGQPTWKYQLDAMWAGLERGVPTVNGYSGNAPPGWRFDPVVRINPVDSTRLKVAEREWIQSRDLNPTTLCRVDARPPR